MFLYDRDPRQADQIPDLNEVRELIVSLREDAVWLSCEHPTVDLEIRAGEMLERFLNAAIESRD
jgi:hypothetical protein